MSVCNSLRRYNARYMPKNISNDIIDTYKNDDLATKKKPADMTGLIALSLIFDILVIIHATINIIGTQFISIASKRLLDKLN